MQGAVLAFTPGGSVEWRVAVITACLVMGDSVSDLLCTAEVLSRRGLPRYLDYGRVLHAWHTVEM